MRKCGWKDMKLELIVSVAFIMLFGGFAALFVGWFGVLLVMLILTMMLWDRKLNCLKCRCGARVAPRADSCPNCGEKNNLRRG